MYRAVLVFALLAMTCVDPEDEPLPDPHTCPAAPFEQCLVRDGGVRVYCDGGRVLADDMTTTVYCNPGTDEQVCESPDLGPTQLHTCPSACSGERFFDFYQDYQAFDPAELCTP